MEIVNNVYSAVKSYFNTLSQLGYKKQSDVNKLLVYTFIEEMLTGDMRYFITEEDYKTISKALTCLYGSSCLIPYPQYASSNTLFGYITDGSINTPQITQDENLKLSEEDIIRFKTSDYNA